LTSEHRRNSLPALDEGVKSIVVKNPITQEISTSGSHGTFTVANIEKQRAYNLPQWKATTEEMQHQPPARRGEKRKKVEKPKVVRAPAPVNPETGKRRPGRPPKRGAVLSIETDVKQEEEPNTPLTPTSPGAETKPVGRAKRAAGSAATKREASVDTKNTKKPKGRQPKGSQAKSVSERRKYNQRDAVVNVDEAAFEDFDYRFDGNDEFTAERCQELENLYWKSVTYAPPMYGADMPGSLFDERTTEWNVAKLPNLLDVLGANVPGVNTAYLYLGMWKATFAWHLEDVDLYSINYIHFGAPKQWYSISQEDARRFEKAMQSIWPDDAKHCNQFLRHKTYLISPQVLQSQFNIKVNKLVHNEGEFVITYPYGYHSGYNLGYNCAESVNFANEAWLEYGKIAKKCDCEADSVWVSVEDIERKLRGEPTPEYYEVTDEDEDMEDDLDATVTKLPSPPASVKAKQSRKRKREADKANEKPARPVKKIKIRIKTSNIEPCVLCPNNLPSEPLLPTDTGRHAHRVCALYTPETYLAEVNGIDTIQGISSIDKARMELKCSFCRSKKGACFQCSSKKCTRAYHATCAAAAGVQVDYGPTPVYGDDGTEYISEGYDFRCRIHRTKRNKNETIEKLESNLVVRRFAKTLQPKDTIQMQHLGGEIFAGTVVENRKNERAVIVDILPDGDRVEIDWKYILVLDPHDSQLPKPSSSAIPLPAHMTSQVTSVQSSEFGPPQPGQDFTDGISIHKWAEYSMGEFPKNTNQVKIDLDKENQIWYYLGKKSTDARAQYTENIDLKRHNVAGNFLDTVKVADLARGGTVAGRGSISAPSVPPKSVPRRMSQTPTAAQTPQSQGSSGIPGRPYLYKPRFEQYSPGAAQAPMFANSGSGLGAGISSFKQPPMPMHTGFSAPHAPGNPFGADANLSRHPSMDIASITRDFDRRQSSTLTHDPFSLGASLMQNSMQRDALVDAQKLARVRALSNNAGPHRTTADLSMANLLNVSSTPSMPAPARAASKDLEFVTNIQAYRYLINSYCRRPKVYESPYPGQDGYSNEYAKLLIKHQPSANSTSPHYQEIVPPHLYPIVPPPADGAEQYGLDSGITPTASLQSPWTRDSNQQQYQPPQHSQKSYYSPLPLQSAVAAPPRSTPSYFPPFQYQTPAQFSQQLKQQQDRENDSATGMYDAGYDRLFAQMKQNVAGAGFAQTQMPGMTTLPPMALHEPTTASGVRSGMSLKGILNDEPGGGMGGWR